MRLLFVHDRFGAMAGAEINIQLTGSELKKRGWEPGLLHGPSTGRGEEGWHRLFCRRFPLSGTDSSAATLEAIEEFQPDLIYVHKMSDPRVLETLGRCGRPVVRMVHDHDLYCLRSYRYFPLTRKICTRPAGFYCVLPCGAVLARNRGGGLPLKWRSYRAKKKEIQLNRRFHRMLVATEYMRQQLLRNGFDPRRVEIHAPVPRTAEDAPQASFDARNLIVYSGQIIRGKGVDVLLRALALVEAPFECVILGDGSHRPSCERLARKLGLGGRVRFLGYQSPEVLKDFYKEASVSVVSSVWPEPFGATGLEAMRHGLPVVAFDSGGIGEWLRDGHNGFLVPWMDHRRFAGRLEQLLDDKALARQLGRRGRLLAREKFSFEDYIDGLCETFTQVIHESTLSPAHAPG